MPLDLTTFFVVEISSSALFDLRLENRIFVEEGLEAYCEYQIAHEDEVLSPGTGFSLVQAILRLNSNDPKAAKRVIVVVISKNNADTSLRVGKSIRHHDIEVVRGAYTGGAPLAPHLKAFSVDLFLSASAEDVQEATNCGFAAGLIYPYATDAASSQDGLRVAFNGDAVLFSDESEAIYKKEGIEAFLQHETANARKPLADGPFAKLFRSLALLQRQGEKEGKPLIRTALVTARNSPADERVIRTLRSWGVRVDEAFFLGGASKVPILEAFRPHIFFDDQDVHCLPASSVVPTARVLTPMRAPKQLPIPFNLEATTAEQEPKKPVGNVSTIILPLQDAMGIKGQ